jgi:DNA-binding MarR family transcriptional regulator
MSPKKQIEFINAIQDAADQPLDRSVLLNILGFNLRQAYLSILPMFQEHMTQFQLRPVDFTVLSLLKSNPNINQKRLSQAVNVSQPNLALLLDHLGKRGLLIRQRNPADKRSQTLMLTPDGMRLCAKAEKKINKLETDVTAALTATERVKLLRLLQKIFLTD